MWWNCILSEHKQQSLTRCQRPDARANTVWAKPLCNPKADSFHCKLLVCFFVCKQHFASKAKELTLAISVLSLLWTTVLAKRNGSRAPFLFFFKAFFACVHIARFTRTDAYMTLCAAPPTDLALVDCVNKHLVKMRLLCPAQSGPPFFFSRFSTLARELVYITWGQRQLRSAAVFCSTLTKSDGDIAAFWVLFAFAL